jgi:GWxTD domain-containing protein
MMLCRPSIFGLLILGAFLSSCMGVRKAGSAAKPRDAVSIHALVQAVHTDSIITHLHYQLQSEELLYTRTSEKGVYFSRVKISYKIFPNYVTENILDSGTIWISDSLTENKVHLIYGNFPVKILQGSNCLAEIIAIDENRKTMGVTYLRIYKTSPLQRENFFVNTTAYPSSPLPNYTAEPGSMLRIHYRFAKEDKLLQVRYYKREFPFPPPPFSGAEQTPFDYKADSIFYLRTDEQQNAIFIAGNTGFYHIVADTNSTSGYTLFIREKQKDGYYLSTEMLRYMRYIVNRQEYAELTESKDPKASLDEIWLRFSPNKERAKQLIGIYFNRVQFSNRFFNSHLPGWKTDRGLIFIVFGYPSKILSDDTSETWVYGEGNTIGSINFVFTKIENPFSDNDFALNRAEFYKELWQRTVDAWRQGRLLSER